MEIDALQVTDARPTWIEAAVAAVRRRAGLLGLAGVVAGSFAVRGAVAASSSWTPRFFPDEYIYGTLARSIAESGRLAIRGAPTHFPALLEPLLAAPLWLTGDPATAYRLTLEMHAAAMSLAAIPVYLLARRLGLGTRVSLAAGALAVASPALTYANWLTADAVAYPLVLTTVALYVHVLARPGKALQVAAAAATALSVLARVQFVLLPVVFVLAALVVERGSLPRVIGRFPLTIGLFLAPVAAAVGLGPSRVLGYYSSVTSSGVHVTGIVHWFAVDATLVALSVCVLAPGAVVALAGGLARPRSRPELAFAAVAALLACGLLLESAFYATGGAERFQERYLITIAPLAAPAFALSLSRGARARWASGLLAAGLLLFAIRVPLSGYVYGSGKQDSPLLLAVSWLQGDLGVGTAGLVVALAAGAMCVVAVAAPLHGRIAAAALGAALAASIAVSAGAVTVDQGAAARVRRTFLPADPSWVDHSGLGAVDVLAPPGTSRGMISEQMLWNPSIRRVLLLPQTVAPDGFGSVHLRVGPDGTLLDHGRAVRRPLLVEDYDSATTLAGAQLVRRTANTTLWRPNGPARLSTLTRGRYFDGWLADFGSVEVWPDASGRVDGTLKLHLFLPHGIFGTTVVLSAPGFHRRVHVGTGGRVDVAIPVHAGAAWTLRFRSSNLRFLGDGRAVTVEALPPIFERTHTLKPARASADRA